MALVIVPVNEGYERERNQGFGPEELKGQGSNQQRWL